MKYNVKYCIVKQSNQRSEIYIMKKPENFSDVEWKEQLVKLGNERYHNPDILEDVEININADSIWLKGSKIFYIYNQSPLFEPVNFQKQISFLSPLSEKIVKKFPFRKKILKGFKAHTAYIRAQTELYIFKTNRYIIYGNLEQQK